MSLQNPDDWAPGAGGWWWLWHQPLFSALCPCRMEGLANGGVPRRRKPQQRREVGGGIVLAEQSGPALSAAFGTSFRHTPAKSCLFLRFLSARPTQMRGLRSAPRGSAPTRQPGPALYWAPRQGLRCRALGRGRRQTQRSALIHSSLLPQSVPCSMLSRAPVPAGQGSEDWAPASRM